MSDANRTPEAATREPVKAGQSASQPDRSERVRALYMPLLAILTALILSGLLIVVTDLQVVAAFTRIPRQVADPFTDPTTQISLEEALWRHPNEIIIGDVVDVDGKPLRVVETVEQPDTQITLADARAPAGPFVLIKGPTSASSTSARNAGSKTMVTLCALQGQCDI